MIEQLKYNPKDNTAALYWAIGGLFIEGANWTYDDETGIHTDIQITNSALIAKVNNNWWLYGIHETHIFSDDYTAYLNPDPYIEKALIEEILESEYYKELCEKPIDPNDIYDFRQKE